ncbi:VWA domain-containing protein [Pseudarthrobacter sp. PS3-L1]|uniref:vWA domain-containing protein n=1 Tax=Pseudarthrobacter sp. PS3-L1 TaxID=3046207 RepID=UPI0024BB5368|nr:VWA domain-containing protein [Pseudarthrobacter sp. PS3-L1]MDJ0319871.1 VWA domain-containing protein [Pseudarthrobacter sp. PS3-L1]
MELMLWWIIPCGLGGGALFIWRVLRNESRVSGSRSVAHTDRLTSLPEYRSALRRHLRLLVAMVGASVVVVLGALTAGARPVTAEVVIPEQHSRDIMLCLDTSASMSSADAAVVDVFGELVTRFDGERIGLMMFDSSAAQVFPLTDDYVLVREELTRAKGIFDGSLDEQGFFAGTGIAPGSSLIGDGLASCTQGFPGPDDGTRSRSVVLATDNFVSGEPLFTLAEAASLARDKGATVYALNPGDFDYGDAPDQPGATLRDAAESTGGAYYSVDSTESVAGIVRSVQETEVAAMTGAPQRIVTDQAAWPLAIALLAVLVLLGIAWRVER